MQLLTGPAGSGKTFQALETLRAALRRNEGGVCLLVPTATMAQHLRNEMAREGFTFSPAVIQTLHRFIEPWVEDLPEVSDSVYYLLVEESVRRLDFPEFARVAHLAGFHARLAEAIDECSAAGCDAGMLGQHLPAQGLGQAMAGVFADLGRAHAERRLGLRATRLALAAERIREAGTGLATAIWLDGFFTFSDPELAVVSALAKHAEVTVTLPSGEIAGATRARLLAMGFEERALTRERAQPVRELFVAPSIEREADEIARRILEEASRGRLFREIGVVVRAPDIYVPLLRATLERFGIPARFYFDAVLMEQPAVRYLAGAVDAMLGGWDHAQTLTVMKLAPGEGISAAMDRFDFEVRKRLPRAGLEPLRQLAAGMQTEDSRLVRMLDRLTELDDWRGLALEPARWLEQFGRLRALYRPARPRDALAHEAALEWRSQASALEAFEAAAGEAACIFDAGARVPLDEFWRAVKAALRLTPLRVSDLRRNVVHVLSAYEARQWELPVVFVCGLVEGWFPFYRAPDPFLPEHARRRLKDRGVRIRTAEDAELEEQFLFEAAISRATVSLVLSYPANDGRGEQNLPSLFLGREEVRTGSRAVRPRIVPAEPVAAPVVIRSADLLEVLAGKHREVQPTALESYLQCPFQFFGRHTLKLGSAPPRPDERLEFRACGKIVHTAISEWLNQGGAIGDVFERVFQEVARAEWIPAGYRTELLRARMLADLRRFAESDSWPEGWESRGEVAYRFELEPGLTISCRVDRLVKTADGRAFVVDYKYSTKKAQEYVRNPNLLQGPFYWLAAERAAGLETAGMYYCSLRGGVEYGGWGERPDWLERAVVEPFAPEWLSAAVERSVRASSEIAAGRVAPSPSDLAKCRLCDFRDVCRYAAAEAVMAEGA